MARLNVRSLSTEHSVSHASRQSALSSSSSPASDQENQAARDQPSRVGQGKRKHLGDLSNMQRRAPQSGASHGTKRKRPENSAANSNGNEVVADLQWYDPEQDEDERRKIRKDFHNLQRDLQDNREDYLALDSSGLLTSITRANGFFKEVKQTSDATIDSRFLVSAGDLASKRAQNLAQGSGGMGIDVDEFVSKCITFMQLGAPADEAAPAEPVRRSNRQDEETEEGDALDWELLGRKACFPHNSRPPVPGFLLGPLSVQKRIRNTQRGARQVRKPDAPTTQPDILEEADLQQQQSSSLTHKCTEIRKVLVAHLEKAEQANEEYGENLDEQEAARLLRKLRVCDNGDVSLFEFVISPRSFGQTVENLFYVSFLIKEGSVEVTEDSRGLPTLHPSNPRNLEEQRAQHVERHQAALALDFETWEQLVDVFKITAPLIPHRNDEQSQTSVRGWYNG